MHSYQPVILFVKEAATSLYYLPDTGKRKGQQKLAFSILF
jgi:hypothetical protein